MKKQQLFIAFLLLLLLQLSLQVVGQKVQNKQKISIPNPRTPDRCGVDADRLRRIKEDPTYLIREKEREEEFQRYMAATREKEIREAQAQEAVTIFNKRMPVPAVINSITSVFIQPQIDVLNRYLTNYNIGYLPVEFIDRSSKSKSKTKKRTK